MALNRNHLFLVSVAMDAVREVFPNKTEDEYKRAESTLKTHVKRVQRGKSIIWTLNVPELNQEFKHTERF